MNAASASLLTNLTTACEAYVTGIAKDAAQANSTPAIAKTAVIFPNPQVVICIFNAPHRTSNESRQPGPTSSRRALNSLPYRARQLAGYNRASQRVTRIMRASTFSDQS